MAIDLDFASVFDLDFASIITFDLDFTSVIYGTSLSVSIKGILIFYNDPIPSLTLLHGRSDSLHMRLWARSDICYETKSFKCPREDFTSSQSGNGGQFVEEKYPATTGTNLLSAEEFQKAGFF